MSLFGLFSMQISRSGLFTKSFSGCFGNAGAKYSKIWEPDYLILGRTKTPEYDLINVQIKGYDFAVLEKFQDYIIKIAKIMNINVNKSWAAPQQDLVIHHYKPRSSDVEHEYQMKVSERNVQVLDVQSNIMCLFIEAVLTTCPPGVNISFHKHEDSMEENRYIPNLAIKELEEQISKIESESKRKKNLKQM